MLGSNTQLCNRYERQTHSSSTESGSSTLQDEPAGWLTDHTPIILAYFTLRHVKPAGKGLQQTRKTKIQDYGLPRTSYIQLFNHPAYPCKWKYKVLRIVKETCITSKRYVLLQICASYRAITQFSLFFDDFFSVTSSPQIKYPRMKGNFGKSKQAQISSKTFLK